MMTDYIDGMNFFARSSGQDNDKSQRLRGAVDQASTLQAKFNLPFSNGR